VKILLVDDHDLFIEGIANLLKAQGFNVVGKAKDGIEALEQARSLTPDVILMDISMPRCDGLTATKLIKTELPAIKIVILTMSEQDENLFEALKSGASGYLLKNLNAKDFYASLIGLTEGEPALSPGLTTRIFQNFHQGRNGERISEEKGSELNERQMSILLLVVRGYSYHEIAVALCIAFFEPPPHSGYSLPISLETNGDE
jgi:DNA-binding NarL/FixJ family response regulator